MIKEGLRCEKRHMLLLEVLIAFTLIVLTIIPLIYPHTAILKSEQEFVHKIELDHFVNQFHAKIVESLYNNEINWQEIVSNREVRIELPKNLPFKGVYQFTIALQKPREDAEKKLYLMNLDYKFTSLQDKEKETVFHYDLFIVRDLTVGENVQQ